MSAIYNTKVTSAIYNTKVTIQGKDLDKETKECFDSILKVCDILQTEIENLKRKVNDLQSK